MPLCAWCGCEKERHTGGSGVCNTSDCECRHYAEGRYGDYEQVNGATLNRVDLKVALLMEELEWIANECLHSEDSEESLNAIRNRVRELQKKHQA